MSVTDPHILTVEDSPTIALLIEQALRQGKKSYQISYAYNGHQALKQVREVRPDLITLDLHLPGTDGYQIAKQLRSMGISTPILMITATDNENSEAWGLQCGCDDYLTKPFSAIKLQARVEALLRRAKLQQENILTISFADLTLNTQTHTVCRRGQRIVLTAKEYRLLEYFMLHKQQLLTRGQLLTHVWDYDEPAESNFIDVTLGHLRKKLGEPSLIQTIRGSGFILDLPQETR
jgi:DNA-binding response OmpR family regulator